MPDHFYGIAKGAGLDPSAVTVNTVTTGLSVELKIHDGDGHKRMSVLQAIDALTGYFNTRGIVTP